MICSVVSCFCSGRGVIDSCKKTWASDQQYHTLLSSGVLVLYSQYSLEPISLKTVDKPSLAGHDCNNQTHHLNWMSYLDWKWPWSHCFTAMLRLTATQGDRHCFLIRFIFGTQLEHGSWLSALSGSRQSSSGKQKENCKQSVVACSTLQHYVVFVSEDFANDKNKKYADNAQLISIICLLNWTTWTTYHPEMYALSKTSHPRVQAIILDDTHAEQAIIVDMGRLASTWKMEGKTSWMRRAFAGTLPESKWDHSADSADLPSQITQMCVFHYFGTSRFTTRTEDLHS